MKHVVSLSGGTASAVAGDLVIKKYGKENVTLWFADTQWEDEDLYRFLEDLENYWDMKITRYVEGRNPLQFSEDWKVIANGRMRICSKGLKSEPFFKWIKQFDPKPVTVHLGMDWSEEHRMATPIAKYGLIKDVELDFPLIWKPIITKKYSEVVKSWGIEIPRLYKMGFPHNNCGGRCIAQGKSGWKLLQDRLPERLKEVAEWEDKMRKKHPEKLGKMTILKGTTLKELAKVGQDQMSMFDGVAEDSYGCFCAY